MHYLGTIFCPTGAAASSALPVLDLADKTTHADTVIGADSPTRSPVPSVRMIGDGGGALSIVVDHTTNAVVIHYRDGVSTVGDVETAIAALAGADKVIVVQQAGTGATVLHSPADDFTATALASTPIPEALHSYYLQSDTDQVQFEDGQGASFATTKKRGAFIPAGKLLQGTFATGRTSPVISIRNDTGGPARVNIYSGGL